MMKKVMKLLIVATLFVSPSFADCYDALHKQAEDIKEIRWKACFEEGSTADLDEKSCQAVDHVSLKTSALSDEYANGKERIEVLKILWQRWDVIQARLSQENNLNFSYSDADPRRRGHFCALHVMKQGITALYKDPTLGVEDGVFFKHMADYGRTADQALKNYYTDKALKTLFPRGFFLDVFKCGAMKKGHMDKVGPATMFRGENFTAKAPDFFDGEGQPTTYTFEKFENKGPIGRVHIKGEIDQRGTKHKTLYYLKPDHLKDPAYSRFCEVYGQHHKDMLYKEPFASLEDALMHAFDETYDKPFTTKVIFEGDFEAPDDIFQDTTYYPYRWALGEGFQNLKSYLEFLLHSEQGENPVPRQFDLEKLYIFFNEKRIELGNSIHDDWKRFIDNYEKNLKNTAQDDFLDEDSSCEEEDLDAFNTQDYLKENLEFVLSNDWVQALNSIGFKEIFDQLQALDGIGFKEIFDQDLDGTGFKEIFDTIMPMHRPESLESFKADLTKFLDKNSDGEFVTFMVNASFECPGAWDTLTKKQKEVFKTTVFQPIREALMANMDEICQWLWDNWKSK